MVTIYLILYTNSLPSILRYCLLWEHGPAMEIINLAKEKKNSRAFTLLQQTACWH